MDQVLEFFSKLFDSSDWPPRWHCGRWTEFHGWLYIISDLLIWSAYFSIPLVIIKYISKKQGIKFVKLYFLFAAFILACGSTHFFDAVSFWYPLYRINALSRLITGILSWITVFSVVRLLPTAFSLRSQEDLETEIDQRKKAEVQLIEQGQKINLFVKHTPAAIAMFDNEMRYVFASDRWYADYQLTGQKIIGENYYAVNPEIKNMSEWKAIHQRCLNGEVEKRNEEQWQRIDGQTEWMQWEIRPWTKNDGSIGGVIMFTEIITEKIAARESLKKLNDQLVISNNELEQFAYVASHDLQEPLRMVSSFLQLLQKKYEPKLDETAGQYIHFAVDGAERMKVLIKDLLAFSRVATVKQEMGPVNTEKIIEDTKAILMPVIQESGASINFFNLPVITADELQMKQIFQNLVSNAIKYAGQKKPEVAVRCYETDSHWRFSVEDNGIGINKKYYDKIFVVFQRLHTRSAYSGTGIGLAICKKIAEKHEGSIWLESEEGKGSTFYFTVSKKLKK